MISAEELNNMVRKLVDETSVNSSEEVKQKMREDIDALIAKRMDASILSMLPEENLEDYSKIVLEEGENEAFMYAAEKIENFEEKLDKVIIDFLEEYKNNYYSKD